MTARRCPAAIVALLVLVVAAPVLAISHHAPKQPLAAHAAIGDALRNPSVVHALAGTHWTAASTSALDGRLERVSFFRGARTLVAVAVAPDGAVDQIADYVRHGILVGDWIAYEPSVLICLSALFALMLAVVPVRRLRNLDVLAVLSLLGTVLLYQHGYVSVSVLAVLPGLCYLALRCAWRALGRGGVPGGATPLFDWVTRGWQAGQQVRVLRLLLLTLALVFAMVGVSSPGALDVVYAVMEGATKIVHGVLPYGHLPGDVVHGDTYPILSYALYAPLAWVAPVDSTFSSVDAGLAVAVLAALASAAALFRAAAGTRLPSRRRAPGAEAAGLRAAIAWLSFPPLLIIASTGTTDIVLAAMVAFAVLLWRRPGASMALLAVAGWFKLAPFALVPVWLAPLRGRRLAASIGALAGVSAAAIALLVALGGIDGPVAMVHAVTYQLDRGSLQSPWAALGITGLQPIGEACVLALIAAAVTRVHVDGELGRDPSRIAALAAAILIALQLVANYWTFLYLVWIMPLIGLSLLAEGAGARAYARARVPALAALPESRVPSPAAVLSP